MDNFKYKYINRWKFCRKFWNDPNDGSVNDQPTEAWIQRNAKNDAAAKSMLKMVLMASWTSPPTSGPGEYQSSWDRRMDQNLMSQMV